MPRVWISLAVGLLATMASVGFALSRSPSTVAATNGVPAEVTVATSGDQSFCQPGGTVPAGTTAVRLAMTNNVGPRVALRVLSGSTVISRGVREAGWGTAETVTVPMQRVPRAIDDALICLALGEAPEQIQLNGELIRTPGRAASLRLRMEYLRPGSRSWLSLIPSIARHLGMGRAPSGAWVAYLVIAIMLAISAIASSLIIRQAAIGRVPGHEIRSSRAWWSRPLGKALRAIPRAAWTCGLVAALNAACWTLITPPFQVPDEPSHFAYVQYLAETGRLPTSDQGAVSAEEQTALNDLHQPQVTWHPEVHTISLPSQQRRLSRDLSSPLDRVGPGDAGVAASEPPGYYALMTVPYYIGSGGTLLDRLELMRLLSALMAGLTAIFTFLFVRECLPGAPWAWTVGGLAAALAPLLGFISGAVNPDAMLCAVSAAVFYCLARALRRGLTQGRALALGALTAVGLLSKLNFIGLVPGLMLGIVVSSWRTTPSQTSPNSGNPRRLLRALGPVAIVTAVASAPACVYVLSNLLEQHAALGILTRAIARLESGSPLSAMSYTWQLFLPRLTGMFHYFPGASTTRLWFDKTVGLYGWLDTTFPVWVDDLALAPAALIAALGVRALIAKRAALRPHVAEIVVYFTMSVGLMALIGAFAFPARQFEGAVYVQPRYLLPLLPLAGAFLALAARGLGRRWGPAVGALIVVLFLAHDILSQLQVVARYYG